MATVKNRVTTDKSLSKTGKALVKANSKQEVKLSDGRISINGNIYTDPIWQSKEVYSLDDLVTSLGWSAYGSSKPKTVTVEIHLMRRGRTRDEQITAINKFRKQLYKLVKEYINAKISDTSYKFKFEYLKLKSMVYNHSEMLVYNFDVNYPDGIKPDEEEYEE